MIRPFESRDLAQIDLAPAHRSVAEKVSDAMKMLADKGWAHTLVTTSGDPVVIFAAAEVPDRPADECEVFIFPSRGRAKHRLAFWKGLHEMLGRAQARFKKIHSISHNEPALCKFFEKLGFRPAPLPNRPECVGMRGWVLLAASAFLLDHVLAHFALGAHGLVLADPVTAAAIIGATAAVASTGVAVANYEASQSAAAASKSLANQQASELQAQQEQANQLAATEATTGSTFGFSNENPGAVQSGFGFGGASATAGSPNGGRSQITGMG